MLRRLSALAVLTALVIVPTVMRSQQRVDLRDSTRLSIRLNWQGEAPPKDLFVPDSSTTEAAAPAALVQQPHPARVTPRVRVYDEPVLQPPFDNAPDLYRGPPSLLS